MTQYEEKESVLLGMSMLDGDIIDRATSHGIKAETFGSAIHREQWRFLCELRLHGKSTATEVVVAEAGRDAARLSRMGGVGSLCSHPQSTTLHASAIISSLLETSAKRQSWLLFTRAAEGIKSGSLDLAGAKELSDQASAVLAGEQRVSRSLADIDAEIEQQIQSAKAGTKDEGLIYWGLPKMDKFMLPISRHEYVLMCARPSRGKSSMLIHLAGHNLKRGKKVVIFTLETSDKAVFIQMACQYAKVNWQKRGDWMPEEYHRFNEARSFIRGTKNLLIFDKDLTLDAIEARSRLLASSFKPDLVIGDYLGLVRTKGKDIYERVSNASKAMIPLRKALDCPLVFGQQLKRLENDKEEPTLGALRDSGQLEEDASKVVMLHWTDSQFLDQEHRPYKILQPKFRDGPTTAVSGINFHAPTTRFYEAQSA